MMRACKYDTERRENSEKRQVLCEGDDVEDRECRTERKCKAAESG
jgi:hypothetical protein